MILVNQYNYIYPFEMVQKQFHELCWQLTEIKIYFFIFLFLNFFIVTMEYGDKFLIDMDLRVHHYFERWSL
jgi:hypothetical protein